MGTLTSDGNGILGPVPAEVSSVTGATYYLVETTPPTGYSPLTSPIPVELRVTTTFSPAPTGYYNKTETATLDSVQDGSNQLLYKLDIPNTKIKDADISLIKVDATDTDHQLPNAKFHLLANQSGALVEIDFTSDPYNQITGLDAEGCVITAGSKVTIGHIPEGSYVLREEIAPAGYSKLSSDITFSITDGVVQSQSIPYVDYTAAANDEIALFVISNVPGVELPSTGGEGAGGFLLIGGFLLLLSATAWVYRKKQLI